MQMIESKSKAGQSKNYPGSQALGQMSFEPMLEHPKN